MEPLRAVPTTTTDPYVQIVDIDMSFLDTWWSTIKKALGALGSSIDDDTMLFWDSAIRCNVDGWSLSNKCGRDGFVLVRSSRRGIRRYYKEVLRITGPKRGNNDTMQPQSIECLLYEPELTDQVCEMLAALGEELGVPNALTLYRHNVQMPWVWRQNYTI